MSAKITRICKIPGCSAMIPHTRRVCDTHKKPVRDSKPYEPRFPWQNWYLRGEWRKLSRSIRAEHPFCQPCRKEGRVNRSTQVDHVRPHNGDERLFWDRDNLQAICSQCHGLKTRTERGGGTYGGQFDLDGRDEV